jgi:hypothetical protein
MEEMLMSDHERIWLQHPDDAEGQETGRMWCQDKVWPEHPEDHEPTEYVRADLYVVAQDEIERLRANHAVIVARRDVRNDALEAAAKVADEWEPLERLLPFGNHDQNECAHTGQHEAAERIAAAIRALKGGE